MSARGAIIDGAARERANGAIDVASWAATAERGDYLSRYWDGEDDSCSRCGWSDSALGDIRRRLAARDLTLRADDCGLVVEARS